MFNSFFFVLKQSLDIYLSFRFFSVLPGSQPERRSSLFGRYSFFFLLIIIRFDLLIQIRGFRIGKVVILGIHVFVASFG